MNRSSFFLGLCLIGLIGNLSAQIGKVDNTFGSNGIAEFFLPQFRKMLLQDDGKILAGGGDAWIQGIWVLRCKTNGRPDASFGNWSVGVSHEDFDLLDVFEMSDIALFSDGSILYSGLFALDGILYKLTPQGIPDSTFGLNAMVRNSSVRNIIAIKIQKNDKIIALGKDQNWNSFLLKFLPNGDPDSSFGTNGKVRLNEKYASNIEIQDDWKTLVGGMDANSVVIKRFQPNGLLDITFADSGEFSHDLIETYFAKRLLLQKDKKILFLANGAQFGKGALVRLNSNGAPDSSFAMNGILDLEKGNKKISSMDIGVQEDLKILICGSIEIPGDTARDFWIQRHHSDGNLDLAFGDSGYTSTRFYHYAQGLSLAIQRNGRILVGGISDVYNPSGPSDYVLKIVRYLSGLNLGILDFREKIVEHQIFPNPIESSATLTFSLSQSEKLSIQLFDLHGREVKSFRDCVFFSQGKHEVLLSFDDFMESGYYLLSVGNENQVFNIKLLKK